MHREQQNLNSIAKAWFKIKLYLLILFGVSLYSCTEKKDSVPVLFKALPADRTGLNFTNKLTPTSTINMFKYMYFYNGAGVGAGDFNNDGLIDLFFSANQQANKLFVNIGDLKFKDVTAAAKIPQDNGWATGVSVVDINNDGLLDIYVCKVGQYETLKGTNQLLICEGIDKNGVPFYADKAKDYGLDFSGFSTQSAFFDYDLDGDLDMYLLNHSLRYNSTFSPRDQYKNTYDSLSGDRMYRNDKTSFTNVTRECGINSSVIGYGLGIAVSDINLDGYPDLYIGNDFHENDYLYINQKNGTFSEELTQRTMHISQFSMGVDVADINNDAYPEIISVDMLPADPYILKRSLGEDAYDIFQYKVKTGYHHQYARNTLQLNRRNGMFSETGLYSGVYATDWSWAPLWLDFNNDGSKDLFVSNGIPKRLNDIDYVNFVSSSEIQGKIRNNKIEEKDMALIDKFPEIKLRNKFFINTGNVVFEDKEKHIEGEEPGYSNGAAFADFDNDGDLDIVVNNIDAPVVLYENKSNDKKQQTFLQIKLKGSAGNVNGIGAKLIVFANNGICTYEKYPAKGFQSSMEIPLHAGLDSVHVDSMFLVWPDNTYQSINWAKDSNKVSLTYNSNLPAFDYSLLTNHRPNTTNPIRNITNEVGLHYKHEENAFVEFDREPLIPFMVSKEGPALAVADIDKDGLEDVFVGSSKRKKSAVFLQQPSGHFTKLLQTDLENDSVYEDVDACWADVNNDSHLDLVVASGGNEYYGHDEHQLPRVYLNDGNGHLKKLTNAFDSLYLTASCVIPYDFNNDGYIDLFIGGRAVPFEYGQIPESYLLENDKTGRFKNVTTKYSEALSRVGFVKNARWIDIDKDGDKDLVIALEWDGICVFVNDNGNFSKKMLTTKKGWWNFILPCDIDNDGDVDFIVGNLGLNSRLKASEKEPVKMYYADFDNNGKKEQVVSYYLQGREIAFANKDELQKQIPLLKKKFLYAGEFAKASLEDLFGKEKLNAAEKFSSDYFSNAILLNEGNYNFSLMPLPWEAQLTCYRDAIVVNANNDDLPDILLTGNFYENNIQRGRYDADFGTILLNKGKGVFACEALNGVQLKGQVRRVRKINIGNKEAFILARNNDSTMVVAFDDNHQIKRKPSLKKQGSKF